jgi:hypothetical protein
MDFIFMLTRADVTVADCLQVFEEVRPLGLRHIGFKDLGAPAAVLNRLSEAIRASGATSYMEVVSMRREDCLAAARLARVLGVDRLLGGTFVEETQRMLQGAATAYFPFPGRPEGHPTKLGGTAEEIESDCRAFEAKGCAGADLLAYRATEADPLALVRAARRGLGSGKLIVAGSIDSAERIGALRAAGADAFTIGSAIFDGTYGSRKETVVARVKEVIEACGATSEARG